MALISARFMLHIKSKEPFSGQPQKTCLLDRIPVISLKKCHVFLSVSDKLKRGVTQFPSGSQNFQGFLERVHGI